MTLLVLASIAGFLAIVALFLAVAIPATSSESTLGSTGAGRPLNQLTGSAIGPIVLRLAKFNERDFLKNHRRTIDEKLLYAGRPWGGVNAAEYLGAAEFAGLAVFGILLLLFTMASGGITLFTFVFAAMMGALAVWVPHVMLDNLSTDRQREIARQFPFYLDLAVMCMESGSTFEETTEIYVRDNPDDAMSEELRMVLSEIGMGKRVREALEALSERVTAEEVQNTLRAIVQGLKMGTPLGEVLREQAETMRFKRSQMAERAAEEIKVRVQPPMVVMMMAVFLLILGPALVEVFQQDIY